jgi:non-homologous end joining protein Ku
VLSWRLTLRYPDGVTEPSRFAEIKDLPEAEEEELAQFTQIVDKLTVDLNLGVFHDSYKEKIEAMIKSKMTGEVA